MLSQFHGLDEILANFSSIFANPRVHFAGCQAGPLGLNEHIAGTFSCLQPQAGIGGTFKHQSCLATRGYLELRRWTYPVASGHCLICRSY